MRHGRVHTENEKMDSRTGADAPVRLLFAECFSLRAATGSVSSGKRIEAFRTVPGAVPAFTRRFSAPTIRRGAHSSFLPIRFGCVRRCAAERYVHKRMTWERLTHPALTQLRRAAPVMGRQSAFCFPAFGGTAFSVLQQNCTVAFYHPAWLVHILCCLPGLWIVCMPPSRFLFPDPAGDVRWRAPCYCARRCTVQSARP